MYVCVCVEIGSFCHQFDLSTKKTPHTVETAQNPKTI